MSTQTTEINETKESNVEVKDNQFLQNLKGKPQNDQRNNNLIQNMRRRRSMNNKNNHYRVVNKKEGKYTTEG